MTIIMWLYKKNYSIIDGKEPDIYVIKTVKQYPPNICALADTVRITCSKNFMTLHFACVPLKMNIAYIVTAVIFAHVVILLTLRPTHVVGRNKAWEYFYTINVDLNS
jgi:hypothetical protein